MARSPYRMSGSLPPSLRKLIDSLQKADDLLALAARAVADAAAQADSYGTLRGRLNKIPYAISDIADRVEREHRKVTETWIEKGIAL